MKELDKRITNLITGVLKIISMIPLHYGQSMGRMLGLFASLIPLDRFSVSLNNIMASFNGIGLKQAKRLNRRVLMHFGEVLFEIPHIIKIRPDNLSRYVVFKNEHHLLNALEKDKGAFVLTGHFGNWELMAIAVAIRFGNCAVIVRELDFKPLNTVITRLRTLYGTEIISKKKGMRRILRAIKDKKIIGILLDQNVDWYEGVFVPFFGRWACTNKGLALLVGRTGVPVVPAFSIKRPDGRYDIVFEKEVDLSDTGDKLRDVEENTIRFTAIIEDYIRRYPDHWFWFHKRWKTKNYCPLPYGE